MTSLPFFPTPLPDETLYSMVGRYHRLGGYKNDRDTCRQLFGNINGGFMHDFPCGIDMLCKSIDAWDGKQSEVIRKFTILPFYEPFISPQALKKTMVEMRHGHGERIKFILGLTASRVDATHPLRCCPLCMSEDITTTGASYWHRVHQLPGVHICDQHSIPLSTLKLKTNRLAKYRYLLPCDIPPSQLLQPIWSNPQLTRQLLEFSRNAKVLLSSELRPFDANNLRALYQDGAAAFGMKLSNGNIDQQRLKAAFTDYFAPLSNFPTFAESIASAQSDSGFIAALMRKPRSLKHPIKHLLMIQFLFGKIENFIIAPTSFRDPLQHVSGRERLRESHQYRIDELFVAQMRDLLIERKMSLRAAAKLLGITTSTLATRAELAGFPVKRRSRILETTFHGEISLALRQGKMIKDVCTQHCVSKSTVLRLLQVDKNLRDQWERARFIDERDIRRAQLRSLIHKIPYLTRSELRHALGTGYFRWLSKNDKNWLESVLPVRIHGKQPNRKSIVNWADRDRKFKAEVLQVTKQALDYSGRPYRVTRSTIFRAIPELGRKAENLSKLPATELAIQSTVESTDVFHKRLLSWAIKVRSINDGNPSRSSIFRAAGITHPRMINE